MTRVNQGAFSGGIMSADMLGRADTEKYQKGVKDAVNMQIKPQGGIFNRSGNELVNAFDVVAGISAAKPWLLPFAFNTEQQYHLEFAEGVFRIIKEGAYVLDGAFTPLSVTGIAAANPATFTTGLPLTWNDTQLYYFEDPDGTHKLHQTVLRVYGESGGNYAFKIYDGTVLDTTAGSWGAVGPSARIRRVYQQAHVYALADMPEVKFAQDADVMYLAHRSYPVQKIGRVAEDNWTSGPVAFQTGMPGLVTGLAGTSGPASGTITYRYTVAPVSADDEEGLPCTEIAVVNDLKVSGNRNILSWSAVAGAVRYRVYRRDNIGDWGMIATTTRLGLIDQNINDNLNRRPIDDRNPFPSAGKYPGLVSFYEQRAVYASTQTDPQLVEMSRVGSLESFSTTYPKLSDDALKFRLRAQQVNRIHAIIPHDAFAMLTSAAEWELDGQGDGDYISPDRRRVAPYSYFGCAQSPAPLLLGAVALFVEMTGNTVRDYRLGDRSNPPGDLTLLCRDLFEGQTIVSWAFARAPYQSVWVVLADGSVLTLTYVPDQDVWGWTRQQFGGADVFVSQVSVIRETGNVDTPYFVVSRTIDGRTVTMVERQRPRNDRQVEEGYFLDAGFHGDYGVQVGEVSGLLHLRGETVSALVDGDVFHNLVVDSTGTVDFGDRDGQKVSIGLPYVSQIETLGVELETRDLGATQGRFKGISEVAIRLTRSRGVEIGITETRMNYMKEWSAALVGQPIPLKTGVELLGVEGDWVKDATVIVRQANPLPMTISGIAPEIEFRD